MHRFELGLSQPLVIGMRRAAQRMMGGAVAKLAAKDAAACGAAEVHALLGSELAAMG